MAFKEIKSVRLRGDRKKTLLKKPDKPGSNDGRLVLESDGKDRRVVVYMSDTNKYYPSFLLASGVNFYKRDHKDKSDDDVIKIYVDDHPYFSIIQDPYDQNNVPFDPEYESPASSASINYTADTTLSPESEFLSRENIKSKVDSGEISVKSYTFKIKEPKNDEEKSTRLIIWIIDLDASPYIKNLEPGLRRTYTGTAKETVNNELQPLPTAGNYIASSKFINTPNLNPKNNKPITEPLKEIGPGMTTQGSSEFESLLSAVENNSSYTGPLSSVNNYIDYVIYTQTFLYQMKIYELIFNSDADISKSKLPENKIEFIGIGEEQKEPETQESPSDATITQSGVVTTEPFPSGKLFVFNVGTVSNSGILTNAELGTFSVIDPFLNDNPFQYSETEEEDFSIVDDEYNEADFAGLSEVIQEVAYGNEVQKDDLSVESAKNESETLSGETFDLPGNSSTQGSSGAAININPTGMSPQEWKKNGPIVEGSKIPINIAKPPSYNKKITLNKTIMNEYLPVIKSMTGFTTGQKLLAIVQAQKEGYYPGTRSYRTNNPGNIGNTDSGNNRGLKTLRDGIQLQFDYTYNIAKGKNDYYKIGKEMILKPFYSKEIDDHNGPGQTYAGATAFLPGYKFVYTGKIEQYCKLYATGSRQSNSYISTIVSWFRQNGFTGVTEETTMDQLISLNKPVALFN